MINYIKNNNNNNIEWLGDEVFEGGMRVILSNNVEVFIYENGEMDFYDFEKSCEGESVIIKGDDKRYEESVNWVVNNIIVDDE